MKIFGSMKIYDNELTIGGIKVTKLAEKYGTPLYVMDEELIRSTCKEFSKYFVLPRNRIIYAGKAFLNLEMVKIIEEEGLYLDVVSYGELITAYKANYNMEKVYFHGNNKSEKEIELGIKYNVGTFVVDNFYELKLINNIARKYKKKQRILLRVIPEVMVNTHNSIKTGEKYSKFGFPMGNKGILKAVENANSLNNIDLFGLHCHIGSQIFELNSYSEAIITMVKLINDIKNIYNINVQELDVGGGFGIYYVDGDKPNSIKSICENILNQVKVECLKYNLKVPIVSIEPGRSIVGNSGITLYKIGAIKAYHKDLKIISVNGGMYENIRPALYDSKYDFSIADKINNIRGEIVKVVGKCCESGDILIKRGYLQKCKEGDTLVVMSTGAYVYAMASNYNRIPRPPVIIVLDNIDRIMVKGESCEDIIKNDIISK